MQLYIVRHGIAIDREDPKCPPDPERYLTEEGVEKTAQVANGVAALGIAGDLFLTSPYARALQTAEIFANALDYAKQNIRRPDLWLPAAEPSHRLRALVKDQKKKPRGKRGALINRNKYTDSQGACQGRNRGESCDGFHRGAGAQHAAPLQKKEPGFHEGSG